MAYNVRWEPYRAAQCVAEAEKRASFYGGGEGFLYRFQDVTYAQRIDPYEDWDDNWTTVTVVELVAFAVKKWTKCGATLYEYSGSRPRFVNLKATKQFACETIDLAKESFIARKTKQARIYRARADKAEYAITLLGPTEQNFPLA